MPMCTLLYKHLVSLGQLFLASLEVYQRPTGSSLTDSRDLEAMTQDVFVFLEGRGKNFPEGQEAKSEPLTHKVQEPSISVQFNP